MKNSVRRYLISIPVVVILAIVFGHFYVINSEPFEYAEKLVRQSPEVIEKSGNVKDVSVGILNYAIRFSGAKSYAEFNMEVVGDKGSLDVYVSLEKKVKWEVKELLIE